MTDQGKPDRCPVCISAGRVSIYKGGECPKCGLKQLSSPVPAAAPQQLGTCPELRTPHVKGDECGNWTPIVSAPQAESVQSGKDVAQQWLNNKLGCPFTEQHNFIDHNGHNWNLAELLNEFAELQKDKQ